jgi:hypothetical protein
MVRLLDDHDDEEKENMLNVEDGRGGEGNTEQQQPHFSLFPFMVNRRVVAPVEHFGSWHHHENPPPMEEESVIRKSSGENFVEIDLATAAGDDNADGSVQRQRRPWIPASEDAYVVRKKLLHFNESAASDEAAEEESINKEQQALASIVIAAADNAKKVKGGLPETDEDVDVSDFSSSEEEGVLYDDLLEEEDGEGDEGGGRGRLLPADIVEKGERKNEDVNIDKGREVKEREEDFFLDKTGKEKADNKKDSGRSLSGATVSIVDITDTGKQATMRNGKKEGEQHEVDEGRDEGEEEKEKEEKEDDDWYESFEDEALEEDRPSDDDDGDAERGQEEETPVYTIVASTNLNNMEEGLGRGGGVGGHQGEVVQLEDQGDDENPHHEPELPESGIV